MNHSRHLSIWPTRLVLCSLVGFAAGRSDGSLDPVLGGSGAGIAPAVPDTTRPQVLVTVPASGSVTAANNTKVTATFNEAMAGATISGTSFTLRETVLGTAVNGIVSYSASARTATFTPSSLPLPNLTSFTATVTAAATDLAGNALAGNTAPLPAANNHVWVFTTSAVADSTAPTVTVVSPLDGASAQCLTRPVTATFSEPMDAATIDAATFRVTSNGVAVPGTVTYDASNQRAGFVPTATAGFAARATIIATILGGGTGVHADHRLPRLRQRVYRDPAECRRGQRHHQLRAARARHFSRRRQRQQAAI